MNTALFIERHLAYLERIRLARVLWGFTVLFLVGALLSAMFAASPELAVRFSIPAALLSALLFFEGLFYIALALSLALALINAYVLSYANRDLVLSVREPFWPKAGTSSFEAAVLSVALRDSDDTFRLLCTTFLGRLILARLGISEAAVEQAFARRTPQRVSLSAQTLAGMIKELCAGDEGAALFLARQGASAQAAEGAAAWVERQMKELRRARRWWGRERLGRIHGIGKDWAYGEAWRLSRYSRPLAQVPIFVRAIAEVSLARSAAADLESVLSRARETNALLVGDAGSPREAAVAALGAAITSGSVLPVLEHKRIAVFDAESFAAEMKTKQAFETELLHIFGEAARAGNLIVVFQNLPEFIEAGAAVGSDVAALLDEYLAGTRVQIIALAESGAFHTTLVPHRALIQRFERITVASADERLMLPFAEDEAVRIERVQNLFFLFTSVQAAVQAAGRYFMGDSLLDKTADLLHDAAVAARKDRRRVVTPADVFAVVESRAGVPVAALSAQERATLLELEGVLRKRVIGQDRALAAVAGALRRARAGVASPKRPFGSFLFLGPTGVGKTETAKALAAAFFGGEDKMARIDFSEYTSADALERLMRTLAAMVRERPYGVLLLDEFEKTTTEVRHLFLQILDEGFFTDTNGRKVNCRTVLIIATSNAASDLIWEVLKGGGSIAEEKPRIIDTLVARGAFTPELLNRFDGVVLFEPLIGKNLRAVAELMLKKLALRMHEKGIAFVPTARIVDRVVEAGGDPQFGARAMQRAIQDRVERALADKILRGTLRPGDRVELSPEEL